MQFSSNRRVDGPVLTCGSNGASQLYYQVYYYEGDIDLPPGQWWLSASETSRPPDIQNIPNSVFQPFYIAAYLDNRTPVQTASPTFTSLLQPVISTTALTSFNFSAFDADGDSLRYELIPAYKDCTQSIPGTLTPHYGLNAGTGTLSPTAASTNTQGYYDVTVRVSEYRRTNGRWALLGYVVRDLLYLLYPSTNQPPTFTTMQVNGGATQLPGQVIALQPGQTATVTLQATDPDAGQTLRFASDAVGTVPGVGLARIGATNGVQLTWQVPATLPPGRYYLPVAVFDDGCAYNASEERTLTFVVGSTALAARAGLLATTDIYPTPFREQVQFKTVPNQVVVLFDALGREVTRLSSAADGLVRWQPTGALPAGLYFARSATDGQQLARLLRAE